MKKNYRFVDMMHVFAFMSCMTFVACSDDEGGKNSDEPKPAEKAKITSTVTLPVWQGDDGWEVAWTGEETFSVFKDDAFTTPILFNQQAEGISSFESEISVKSPAGTYYAAYPSGCTNAEAFELDLTEQDGTLPNGKLYMAAKATCDENGKLDFTFNHLIAILKFEVTLPETCKGPVLTVTLSADGLKTANTVNLTTSPLTYGEGSLSDISYDCRLNLSPEKKVTVYFHVLPGELSNVKVSLLLDGITRPYSLKEDNLNVEAGHVYTYELSYASPEEELSALMFGTWARTWKAQYYEGQDPYPENDYTIYDPEDKSGLYWIIREDYTRDYALAYDSRSGLYSTRNWRLEEGNKMIVSDQDGESECEVEISGNTLILKSYWDDPVGGPHITEERYMRVDFDPVNDESFSLKYTETGL